MHIPQVVPIGAVSVCVFFPSWQLGNSIEELNWGIQPGKINEQKLDWGKWTSSLALENC